MQKQFFFFFFERKYRGTKLDRVARYVMLLSPSLCIEIEDQVVAYPLRFMHVIPERDTHEIEGLSKLKLRIHINKRFLKQQI